MNGIIGAGIPETFWDIPLSDGETPRQKAIHISTGEGCTNCWFALQDLKAVHA